MIEKERRILEAATRLFSNKGFEATSIQDIARQCDIAKGSIYSYFSSKEELVIAALHYQFQELHKQVAYVRKLKLHPREQFNNQITIMLNNYLKNKQLVDLSNYGSSANLSDAIKRILYRKKYEIHQFYHEGLLSIYGEQIRPFVYDAAIMLEGMLFSFIKFTITDDKQFKTDQLVQYTMNRMDHIVQGLLHEKEQFFSEEEMEDIVEKVESYIDKDQRKMEDILSTLNKKVSTLPNQEQYQISLEVIVQELTSNRPREPVIEGMLSNFKGVPQLEKHIKQLKMMMVNKL